MAPTREGSASVKAKRGFTFGESALFVAREWDRFAAFIHIAPTGEAAVDALWFELRRALNRLAGYPERWVSGDPLDALKPGQEAKHPPYPRSTPFGIGMLVEAGWVLCSPNGVEWRPALGNEHVVFFSDAAKGPGAPRKLDRQKLALLRRHWILLLALAWDEKIRRRIRVCAGCHRFTLLTRTREETKSERAYTCSKACARRWAASPINKERNAIHQRASRKRLYGP